MMNDSRRPHEAAQQPQGCFSIFANALRAILDRLYPPSIPPRRPERISFLPGKIGFLVEHEPTLSRFEIAARLQADLTGRRLQYSINIPERPAQRELVTLGGLNSSFSFVVGDVPAARSRRSRVIQTLVKDLNRQLAPTEPKAPTPQPPPRDPTSQQPPVQQPPPQASASLEALSEAARLRAADARAPFRLVVASPNWLSAGAPSGRGTGGPGGRPVPVSSSGSGSGTTRAAVPWQVSIPPPQQNIGGTAPVAITGDGSGVIVAILDTMYSETDLNDAYNRLVRNPVTGVAPNAALSELWGVPKKLHLYPANATHLLQEIDCELDEQPYAMPDHGLFVAGLIHSVVPQAELHLIEVLNPFGVGSLASIADGLSKVLLLRQQNPTAPIVVNMSLFLNIPQSDPAMLLHLAESDLALSGFTPEEIEQTSYMLQQICYLLLEQNIFIVAAAGNEADDPGIATALGGGRPPARFPAAYQSITGVAALNRDASPAVYSNIADHQADEGIAVFGGNKSATLDLTDTADGLVGLYVNPMFPDGTPNPDGWARWCGTSFATPVVTGALAALLSQNPLPANPLQVLRSLAATPSTVGGVLEAVQ